MNLKLSDETLFLVKNYHLPRYHEIPDVGLYLHQVVGYINEYLEPFTDMAITESMVSNYVKQHLIDSPKKKLYNQEQIACLLSISIIKSVLSLDDVRHLLDIQRKSYPSHIAYDYFCNEFENILQYVFGVKNTVENIGSDSNDVKILFRNVIITATHKIYLDHCFHAYKISNGISKK
jgi:hypothetical protein